MKKIKDIYAPQILKMSNNKPKLTFTITENMRNACISGFNLAQNYFIITFENNRKYTVRLSKNDQSISNTIKRIASTLAKNLNRSENEILEHCIQDIEDQLVERRYEVFDLSVSNNPNLNSKDSDDNDPETQPKKQFIDDINLRKKYKESETTFEHVTVSHNQSKGGSRTGLESRIDTAIEDIALQEVLSVIESVNGYQIAVRNAVISVWGAHRQIRNYLGDKLTTRENRKIKDLYLRIIRHPNIEVIKHKPQLIVRWSDKETLNLESAGNPP